MVGDKVVHTFPKSISLKENVIEWLEFELTQYDVAVQHYSHYTMEFPLNLNVIVHLSLWLKLILTWMLNVYITFL